MRRNSLFDYRIILLFCLIISLPMLPSQVRYFVDEMYYVDAAFRMIQTGDYITPYYSTGELRFNKPILNYWFIVASYKLLGVNQFSARFAHLLFAIGTLWLVFLLGKDLYDKEAGLLAMVIYMSTVQFIRLSTRSMTDMPLTFFMALSTLGFVRMFLLRQRRWTNVWLFYCGGALAVSTKGGFGGWFVLFGLGYACVCYVRAKKLTPSPIIFLHFPTLIMAVSIASFWYITVWLKHGDKAIILFFSDQVGKRFTNYNSAFLLQVLENAVDYLTGFLKEFSLWVLCLGIGFVKDRETIRQCLQDHGEIIYFASGWVLVLVFPLLFANMASLRWFFPSYLLTSLVFGIMLRYFAKKSETVSLSVFSRAIIIGAILLGIVTSVLAIGISWQISLGAAVITIVCFMTLQFIKTRDTYVRLVCLALLLFSAIRINDLIILPEFSQSPTPKLFKFLRTHVIKKTPNLAFVTDSGSGFTFFSQLRLMSSKTLDITLIPGSSTLNALSEFDVIIRYPPLGIEKDSDDYIRTTDVFGYRNWKGKHIFPIFLRMRSKEDVFADPEHRLQFEVLVQKDLWRD